MCCRLTAVPELGKPCGVWCRFCHLGKGCKIYDTRPPSCVKFECLWSMGEISEELRPDKCKVMLEKLPGSTRTLLALVDPGRPSAWREPKVVAQLQLLSKAGLAIVVVEKDRHMLLPTGRTKKDVFDDLNKAAAILGEKEIKQ